MKRIVTLAMLVGVMVSISVMAEEGPGQDVAQTRFNLHKQLDLAIAKSDAAAASQWAMALTQFEAGMTCRTWNQFSEGVLGAFKPQLDTLPLLVKGAINQAKDGRKAKDDPLGGALLNWLAQTNTSGALVALAQLPAAMEQEEKKNLKYEIRGLETSIKLAEFDKDPTPTQKAQLADDKKKLAELRALQQGK